MDYWRVIKLLIPNKPSVNIERRLNSHCISFPNGVSIRILSLQDGAKITIAKRPNRNNEHHFQDAINYVQGKLGSYSTNFKHFGVINNEENY